MRRESKNSETGRKFTAIELSSRDEEAVRCLSCVMVKEAFLDEDTAEFHVASASVPQALQGATESEVPRWSTAAHTDLSSLWAKTRISQLRLQQIDHRLYMQGGV
jgi:hypothetical protein